MIPFYGKLSTKIETILKNRGINVCCKNNGTLRNLIGGLKNKKQDKKCSGIYEIGCDDCNQKYVGQTRRRIEERDREHAWACNVERTDRSSVAEHCVENKHKKGKCNLLKEVKNPIFLDAYESLYIDKERDLMNTGEPPIKSVLFNFC